jgi:small subunit ribosomal protein S20
LSAKGSSAKRHRQNETRRLRNKRVKSRIRTGTRQFFETLESGSAAEAEGQYRQISSLLDSAVNKGIVHRSTAARRKHRLHSRLTGVESKTS